MAENEPEIKVVQVTAYDTGLGREAGFKDDVEMIAVGNAELEAILSKLSPEARKRFEEAEAEFDRRVLFGDDA